MPDDVRIYERAISEDEVKENFNVGCEFGEYDVTSNNKLSLTWGKIKALK